MLFFIIKYLMYVLIIEKINKIRYYYNKNEREKYLMKFIKSVLITLSSNIFIMFLSLLNTIVTSRILGPNGRGIISASNNILNFMITFLSFGITSSNIFLAVKKKMT